MPPNAKVPEFCLGTTTTSTTYYHVTVSRWMVGAAPGMVSAKTLFCC